ncbi:MAG: hypothetical protein KGK07_17310 [Chloroflexota bacterium]|nr:hypothetical protein [Chloroflexota bacterium]
MNALAYAIVNDSTAPELTHVALCTMAADIQTAYARDYAPAHGLLPIVVVVCAAAEVPAGARQGHLVDEIPEAPGAAAYHTTDAHGRPMIRLGVDACRGEGGSLLDAISEALDHEIKEAAKNPFVNRWLSGPWSGKKVADEPCDPVQGSPYRDGSTLLANFTLPAWGDANDVDGPYDFRGVLSAPFACAPSGYLAFDDGTQAFGELVPLRKREAIAQHGRVARFAR